MQSSTTGKAALLIGINYVGTESELQGCVNDIASVRDILIKRYGFHESDISVLADATPTVPCEVPFPSTADAPTADRIRAELAALVASGAKTLYVHYSGHGTSVADAPWFLPSADENDGMDECIVPSDFVASGLIVDDELSQIVSKAPVDATLFAVFDSCNSGTALDLRYGLRVAGDTSADKYSLTVQRRAPKIASRVILLSGCRDDQTSADAMEDAVPQGALTWAYKKVLKSKAYKPRLGELLGGVRAQLARKRYSQVPQLSFSRMEDPRGKFPL